MFAEFEKRLPINGEKIWIAKWLNLKNAIHWHDETEIIYCVSGSIEIFTYGETIFISDGECVLLQGGTPHKINAGETTVCITILVSPTLVNEVTNTVSLKNKKLAKNYHIPLFYKKIHRIMREKEDFYNVIVNSYTTILLAEIFKNEQTAPLTHEQKNSRHKILKDVLKVIETEFAYVTFEDLCKRFGYSSAHFSRLFKELTDMNFTKYLTMVKIAHAVRILQSDKGLSITNIATACGFSSIRNFNRYFKLLTGYAPSELPYNFTFEPTSQKRHNNPFDPTLKCSILLD